MREPITHPCASWTAAARRLAWVVLVLAGVLAEGCTLLGTSAVPVSTPSPTVALVAPSAAASVLLESTEQPGSHAQPITLTLWLPPEMLPSAEGTGELVAGLNRAFAAANPLVGIQVVPKASYGPGGMANMLLTTYAVVPAHAPDVLAIDAAELQKLADADVLIPLGGAVPQALWNDLYPWALEAVTIEGKRLAVPFQTDIVFLVYNSAVIAEPPRAWYDLASAKSQYVFPAERGDGSAADMFLAHYLALGGTLSDKSGRPYLDSTIVAKVLRNYRSAMELGIVPGSVRTMRTIDDCWQAYRAGEAGLTNATSYLYGRDRATVLGARYAQLPTLNGEPITLARSWAWAIVARDPERRAVAIRYVQSALQSEHLAQWSKASFHLPTRRSVLELAIEDRDYRSFLVEQLRHARPYPNMRHYSEVQDAVSSAIEDVLDGVTTPERAAIATAALLARLR